jgi:hypothetical protein
MKQKYLLNAKAYEKGIEGQARNDRPFRMKAIKTVLLVTAVSLYGMGFAQVTVGFGYDEAGNRINRVIDMPPAQAPALRADSAQSQPAVYSEVISDLVVLIYPNPTDGLIRVEIQNLSPKETAEIALYQFSGKMIQRKRGISSFTEIDITGQPAGVYVLKIIAGEKQTEWKIIKK